MKKAKKKAAVVVAQDEDGLRLLQRNARIAKAARAVWGAFARVDIMHLIGGAAEASRIAKALNRLGEEIGELEREP